MLLIHLILSCTFTTELRKTLKQSMNSSYTGTAHAHPLPTPPYTHMALFLVFLLPNRHNWDWNETPNCLRAVHKINRGFIIPSKREAPFSSAAASILPAASTKRCGLRWTMCIYQHIYRPSCHFFHSHNIIHPQNTFKLTFRGISLFDPH
jgi:hypothetical protein